MRRTIIFIFIFLFRCLSVASVISVDSVMINKLITSGELHLTEDADTAIIVLKKAMTVSGENKYESGYIRSGFILSKVYKQKGLFYEALKTVDYLMKYAEKRNNKELKGKCLYTLGEINRAAFYTDKALNYLFESLTISKELKNTVEQAKCYNRISAVYFEKKQMDKSEIYADSSNKIALSLNNYNLISSNEELLGAVYRRTQRHSLALKKLESALRWTMMSKDTVDVPNILNNFAYTYLEMKDFDKAIEYANKSFQMSEKKDILVYTSNAAQILSDCYRAKNQLEKAYNYLRYRDSLSFKSLMNDRNKIIMDLNEKYESGKKEKQRILLQKENDLKNATIKNQTRLFVLFLFVLMIVIAGAIIILINRRTLAIANKKLEFKREKIFLQNTQISESFAKLKELESFKESMTGMIIHDLKNPLNFILNPSSTLTEKQQLESIKQAGSHMLNMVVNILDVQKYEDQNMQLNKENVAVLFLVNESVIQVKNLAEQRNQKIIYEIDGNQFVFADVEIAIRIIVNLLTNAIKHSPNNGSIQIYSEQENNLIKITIEDHGEGIPENKIHFIFDKFSQAIVRKSGLARSTGLGLAFCKLAVEAHGGNITVSSKIGEGSIFSFDLALGEFSALQNINQKALQKVQVLSAITDDDRLILQAVVGKLRTYEIFEISKIKNAMKEISNNQKPSIQAWISKINSAIYSGNDELFREMISLK